MYVAHRTPDGRVQSVKEHSHNTANLCRGFSVSQWQEMLYTLGLVHDIGKYQPDFQKYIAGESIRIPHALCGAKTAKELFGSAGVAMLLQYAIAGHHTGLQDSGTKADTPDKPTLFGTIARSTQDYSVYSSELSVPSPDFAVLNAYLSEGCKSNEELAERFAFLTRYCFSCLTDADWLDTEQFFTGKNRRMLSSDFEGCLQRVNEVLASFQCKTLLQHTRAELQQQAFDKVGISSAVYLMNMPTGSGKTLCSIKFALERALASGKHRIIYIIPYNSIIEQTADTFERIFGEKANILRHQSTYSFDNLSAENEQDTLWLKQATENWDAQIILTTAVQFFESVYSNKRAKLRKLHNMADSILIFDEAHLMPQNYLQPCLRAIAHICKFLHSEAIFLTATMPNYEQLLKKYADTDLSVLDLISNCSSFSAFRKCSFENMGQVSDEALIVHTQSEPSVLIVVNKRTTAAKLYNMCQQGKRYHLSTYMTAFDRMAVISEIRRELDQLEKDFSGLENVPPECRITVVSTSLIEAGVDLDFYTVYRQLWGLDSILQAAGRCNREGKRENAHTYIFEREEECGSKQTLSQSITKGIMSEYVNISCAESIDAYYQRLLFMQSEDIIKNSIGRQCPKPTQIPFKTYSDAFELIDSKTVSVAVERDEISRTLFKMIRTRQPVKVAAVQPYTLTVYQYEFDRLLQQGAVDDYGSGIYWLTNLDYYNEKTGIIFEGKDIFL
ncbi:CRISPR-associated helicase Cas3' [Oscillospiraceae bacterium PP1C4]